MVVPSKPIDCWLLGIRSAVVKPGGEDWKATIHRLEEMGDQYLRSLVNCHRHSPQVYQFG